MAPRSELTPLGLATILVGAFLSIADFFIVNVALPTISSDLHTSSATLELVVAGYGIPYALLLVLGGRLGDLYGRRRLFMLGMSSFTIFSLLCGIAPTDVTLVAFRVAQGASAAFMVPQVLATIQASTTGQRRARALGMFGATAGVAAVVGQLAGGAIVAANFGGESWRPIFLVNVPIGIGRPRARMAERPVESRRQRSARRRAGDRTARGCRARAARAADGGPHPRLARLELDPPRARRPGRSDVLHRRRPARTQREAPDRAADAAPAARHAPRAPDHDAVLRRLRNVHVRQRAHAAGRRRVQRPPLRPRARSARHRVPRRRRWRPHG